MPKKAFSLSASLSNAKTRTFVLLFGLVIILGVALAMLRSSKNQSNILEKQASSAVAIPSQIKSTPGSTVSEQYKTLQEAENERRAQQALQSKTSAIPTLIGNVSDSDKNSSALEKSLSLSGAGLGNLNLERGLPTDPSLSSDGLFGNSGEGLFGKSGQGLLGKSGDGLFGKSPQQKQQEEMEARLREQRERLARMQEEKERQANEERMRQMAEKEQQVYRETVQKMANQMKNYAQGAHVEWGKITKQAYVQGNTKLAQAGKDTMPPHPATGVVPPAITQGGSGSPVCPPGLAKRKQIIKAGTVLFGILDTAVNSDDKSPVLATIVSGKYQGGKLLGSFAHDLRQETVVIQFKTLSLPRLAKSTQIQAVAIDPTTARTAMASDVDHHYLLRYGTLFASSFMAGFGQAIMSRGTTTVTPIGITTTTPPLSTSEKIYSALGEVGMTWAAQMKPIFDTPYTVTINQGTSVGILFLSDVDVSPETQPEGNTVAGQGATPAPNWFQPPQQQISMAQPAGGLYPGAMPFGARPYGAAAYGGTPYAATTYGGTPYGGAAAGWGGGYAPAGIYPGAGMYPAGGMYSASLPSATAPWGVSPPAGGSGYNVAPVAVGEYAPTQAGYPVAVAPGGWGTPPNTQAPPTSTVSNPRAAAPAPATQTTQTETNQPGTQTSG